MLTSPAKQKTISVDVRLADEKARSTRVITALGIILFSIYTIIDFFGLPSQALLTVFSVRLALLIILACIYMLTYKPIFQRHYNKILLFGYLYAGLSICIGVYISKSGEYSYDLYFASIMLLTMTAFSWSYLPIRYSITMSTIFLGVYVLIKIYSHNDIEGTRYLTLISNIFYLGSAVLIAAIAQYIRDNLIFRNLQLQKELKLFAAEKEKEAERHQKLANLDELTGIPNRRSITDSLRREMSESEGNSKLTILFLDLNGFKSINDDFGHDAGDKVLEVTAKRLSNMIRDEDYLARLGGDEFLIAFKSDQFSIKYINDFGLNVREKISAPIAFHGNLLTVGTSIGHACYPEDGNSIEELIKVADKNMYIDKQRCKSVQAPELEDITA